MEINFKTVKALSSPTRVKILNQVLEQEATPTQISNAVDKSKSTVSSHLSTLHKADLIEKDSKEGRRRVTYSPTRKAEAIVEGKERKVKFSLGSSAVSSLIGLTVGGYALAANANLNTGYAKAQSEQLSTMTTADNIGVDAARAGSESASSIDFSSILFSADVLLGISVIFLGIAVFSFIYGWIVNKIGKED